tara:strand:- start:481 stop:744 length:264 start_codon:yes stop_codon:yes gene_type:complete
MGIKRGIKMKTDLEIKIEDLEIEIKVINNRLMHMTNKLNSKIDSIQSYNQINKMSREYQSRMDNEIRAKIIEQLPSALRYFFKEEEQ